MSTLGLSILLALAALILVGSRRMALLGMIAGTLYLTQGQYVAVAGFALYPMRVLEVAAAARILMRREFPFGELGRLDRVLFALHTFTVCVFLLRSREEIAYQIGIWVDALLLYGAFRSFVRNVDDLRWILRLVAVLLIPYTVLVWVESVTFQNAFAPIGGVELIRAGDLWMREGRLRATGSFGHPSLMGTLGGTFLPLYVGLWLARPSQRATALVGIVTCLGVVGASNSGGPMICLVAAFAGWMLWPMRRAMHLVRRGLSFTLIALALVMNAPIWYVLARISDITGGDGYHRAVLLDIGFQNLDRWWLAGMPMRETGSWLPYTNTTTGAVDMTNNFLGFGVTAGLGAVVLLVALLTVAFSQLGKSMADSRAAPRGGIDIEPLYWGLGATLAVHAFNWFGITYWDQTNAIWFFHLAVIGSLTAAVAGRAGLGALPPSSSTTHDASGKTFARYGNSRRA